MAMPPKSQRWWLTTDSQSVDVDAPADRIYDLVADLPRMGEWSNECGSVEWTNGATGAAPDASFVGHNHTGPRGVIKWSRKGRVLTAERGREFAFVTEEGGSEGVVWRYRFEPRGDSTLVTESYEVRRIPTWARILDVPTNRHGALLKSMRHTLERLKAVAESATIPGATH
jgi:uncharacterized membrane protein